MPTKRAPAKIVVLLAPEAAAVGVGRQREVQVVVYKVHQEVEMSTAAMVYILHRIRVN